jgi:8-oxo-dGTP pyrophosphatase MutT (NUDIX family)
VDDRAHGRAEPGALSARQGAQARRRLVSARRPRRKRRDLEQGALREAAEEAGLAVRLTGIHRLQYTPLADGSARLRVIFLGVPAGDEAVKDRPDEHTDGAGWFTFEEVTRLHLRGWEVVEIFEEVRRGGAGSPLDLLGQEGVRRR